MNVKTLKILKKYANMQIPGSKLHERICADLYESLPEKEKKQTLKEIKLFILTHLN